MWPLRDIITNIRPADIVDIAFVAYASYKLYQLIRQTRAEQLVKGILILLIATKVSEWSHLNVVNWILKNTMTVGMIALLIVFQPELRRVLEYLGRTKFVLRNPGEETVKISAMIEEVVQAAGSLSRQKIGALLIFERETGITDIVQTGIWLDAVITRALLINVFIPNTPLHDGAAVVRHGRLIAAGCFLPLSENKAIDKELGTRHRAALGISERSDCISLVVSEETGAISIAQGGKLTRGYSEEDLRAFLSQALLPDEESKGFFKKGVIFR